MSALIVLDNVEHRRSEIAEFALECLAQMRSIRVLATGRTSLGVAGEQRLPIRGLSVPPLRSGIEDVLASEAGSLFLDRLTSLNPDFVFGERVVRSIGGLCRAASGMPLAIQIFASRCAYVSPEEVFTGRYEDFARPETSFGEEERHKSIQLAVSSSFESLEPADQNLLARTAAFRGGFTLDHVRQLNSEGGSSSAAMGRLVTGSLVDIENSGNSELRYLILEPVREFLELECPQFVNEGKEILFSTMKEKLTRLEPKLNADDPTSMDEIEREQDNIAVALSMGLEPRFRADAIKLACCLYRHWTARGYHQEGKAWLESLLTEAEGIDEALLGRAYNTLGAVLGIGGNASASHEAHERAFIHYRSAGDSRGMTSSEISCGIGLYQLKKFDEAVLRFDSASERARSMGAYEYVAYSEANRSSALAFLGRWDESEQIARTLLDSRESISDHLRAPLLLTCIRCSLGRSDAGRTQQLLLELVPLVAGSRDIERLTVTLTLAARHQLLVGKLDLAFYLYTSAKSLSLRAGVHLETWIIADVDSNINDLQEKLSPGVAGDLLRKSHGIRTTTAINLLRDQYIP
ncbi:MAG: ATP-binding protein [Fimbriimonas sp.]